MIDARLRRHPDANRYLVILIPKSASLRDVVELILSADPLKDPKYDVIKNEFAKALEDLSIKDAVIHFSAHLQIELEKYKLRMLEELKQDPTNTSLKQRIGHAENLPRLMDDAATINHFRSNVLPRIIQRSVRGLGEDPGEVIEVDPTASQFNRNDLDLSHLDLGSANLIVQNYYKINLLAREGRSKDAAVEVLNDVLDQATSQLYKLNESLGGMTLGGVIQEIRRLLISEDNKSNRELVFLVEDFSALIGIQETLAKILIQEGNPSGVKKFCTIRSAIAVTDGYLLGKQTLATRAGREWIIESHLDSEEDTLRRTRQLVAAYLNASRIGENGLKKYYEEMLKFDNTLQSPKIFQFDNDDENTTKVLNNFGYEGEIPLFPYTAKAIECLAHSSLTAGSFLTFNPRFIILKIINPVLKFGREAFINKQFPPVNITTKKASGSVALWLDSLKVSEDQKYRYERLITTWGNDPETIEDIGLIPSSVYEAFDLPVPNIAQTSIQETLPPQSKSENTSTTAVTKNITDNNIQQQKIKDYTDTLEKWVRNDATMPQTTANTIRKSIVALLNRRIDWNAERCTKRAFELKHIFIQNAGGSGNIVANTNIKISIVNNDENGQLRTSLIALLRYTDVYKGVSDYQGMDDDMVNVANLIEDILPSALSDLRDKIKKQNHSSIISVRANSRFLGTNIRKNSLKSLSMGLFAILNPPEILRGDACQNFNDFRAFQNDAFRARSDLQSHLITTNGCFQGTGETAWGIDIVRLLEDYPEDNSKIDLADFPINIREFLQSHSEIDASRKMSQVIKEANKTRDLLKSSLGETFDKNEVANALKELANQLRDMGGWDKDIGISNNDYITLCNEFSQSSLIESLNDLETINTEAEKLENKTSFRKISSGEQLRLNPFVVSDIFVKFSAKLISFATKYAERFEKQYGDIRPEDKVIEIKAEFESISKSITLLERGQQ
jgi:hypothetical protein